jgi:hypothetical protein
MHPYSSRTTFQRYQEHVKRHHCLEALNMTMKQTNQNKGCVDSLAIHIKKYLKAKEEVWKLMVSPTSINEKITYWRQKTAHPSWQAMGTPKSSSLPEFQWREFHLLTNGFEHRTFLRSQDPEGSIPVNGHHPAPNPFLHTARNMPKQSAQPQVGKTLKLCKNNYFEGT